MRSEAQKKADEKYIRSGKCKYKTIAARLHINQAEEIQAYSNSQNLTVSKFMTLAAEYCIKNNIQLNDVDDNT